MRTELKTIAVLGAGPHGRNIARELHFPGQHPYLYDDDEFQNLEPTDWGARAHHWVAGQAWPWTRREAVARIHAFDGIKAPWNNGVVVLAGAQVSAEATLYSHVHVCPNAVVSHGCLLGNYVSVFPGALLCGDVTVLDGAMIGAGAVILHTGITIGRDARVGAGAVVTKDVPDNAVVVGNPAKFGGWVADV